MEGLIVLGILVVVLIVVRVVGRDERRIGRRRGGSSGGDFIWIDSGDDCSSDSSDCGGDD